MFSNVLQYVLIQRSWGGISGRRLYGSYLDVQTLSEVCANIFHIYALINSCLFFLECLKKVKYVYVCIYSFHRVCVFIILGYTYARLVLIL